MMDFQDWEKQSRVGENSMAPWADFYQLAHRVRGILNSLRLGIILTQHHLTTPNIRAVGSHLSNGQLLPR